MVRRLLVCCLLGLLIPILAQADTLVVAGRTQQLANAFVTAGQEVLAPVMPSLRLLGVSAKRQGDAITLTNGDHVSKLKLNATAAEIDGRKTTLSLPPREVDGDICLPVSALSTFLGVRVRYLPETQTLILSPLVSVSVAERNGGALVMVRSAAPLQYTSGWLRDPARAFFDFKNVAVKGDEVQQFDLDGKGVTQVRLSQFKTAPDMVRVVAECDDVRTITTSVDEHGRLVTITIGDILPVPSPPSVPDSPPAPPVTPSVSPIRLLDAALNTLSSQQSELIFKTTGQPTAESSYDARAHQLVLSFANAEESIPAKSLKGLGDRLVDCVAVASPTPGTVTATITFKRDAGYLVHQESAALHVQIGAFSMKDMLVILDAGDGDHDTGAVGPKGTLEKNINLDVILRAAKLLSAAGARVMMTRNDDTFIPLDGRSGLANTNKADIFISVHCNSSPKVNSGKGTQVYYRTPQSLGLASVMHEELIKSLELYDGGVRNANFSVIRKSYMPSVLLEIAFINNEREEQLLNSTDFRQKVAEAILNGVRHYAASSVWKLRRGDLLIPTTQEVAAK